MSARRNVGGIYLRLPLVNTTSDIQKHLARAAADYVAGRTAAQEEEET